MTTITTRSGKGSPLTNNEVDANFTNLNSDKYESGDSASFSAVTVDNITIDGSEIDVSSGDLTLDVAGDIILDADGGDVRLSDAGTQFGKLSNSGTDLVIESLVSDRDMVFKGNDGGSSITALTLDMSAGGTAFFADDVRLTDNHAVRLGTDGDIVFYHDNSNGYLENGTGNLTLDVAGDIILDAAGDDIIFKTGGVEFGSIFYTNSNLYLNSSISNGDIVFRGNDDGSAINALVLDMSAAGAATFNSSVKAAGLEVEAATPVIEIDSTTSANLATLQFATSGTVDSKITHQASTGVMTIDSGRNASWGGKIDFVTDTDTRIRISNNGDISFYEDTGTTAKFFWDASAESLDLTGAGGLDVNTATGSVNIQTGNASADIALGIGSPSTANKVVVTAGGDVGIGVASPSGALHIHGSSNGEQFISSSNSALRFVSTGGVNYIQSGTATSSSSAADLIFTNVGGTGETMRITSAGNVGIGASTVDQLLHLEKSSGTTIVKTEVASGSTVGFEIAKTGATTQSWRIVDGATANGVLEFYDLTNTTTRMGINGSGKVSIGSSSFDANLRVGGATGASIIKAVGADSNGYADVEIKSTGTTGGSRLFFSDTAAQSGFIKYSHSGNSMEFGTNNTECARFSSSGDMEIGSNRVNQGAGRYLDIYNRGTDSVSFSILRLITEQVGSTSLSTSEFYKRKNGETTLWNHETSSDAYLRAGIGTTEGWRIHSSGNVLLGKSSPAFGTAGVELNNNGVAGKVHITRSGGEPLALNRLSSEGPILELYNDGSQVGILGVDNTDNLTISGNSSHAGLNFSTAAVLPYKNGNYADDAIDLGEATSARWQDIYATNGTIQTSDRNDKQDIEGLSDAEQRVAVACKGLLRKFRWRSAVEEKGDDARIHFGIIAQDLQDAFTAEGLDAGRYGMFINSTWTDEETGEERSRMGVRYSELLAFIISAI